MTTMPTARRRGSLTARALLLALTAPAIALAQTKDTPALEAPAATVDLLPGPAVGRLDRVTVEIEVGGQLLQPSDPADRTSKIEKAPMSVRGRLAYDERRLTETRSVRDYTTAEATIKTGERGKTPELPNDRRLIVADMTPDRVELLAARGPLTREQLDLVDALGATLGVDALLPTKAVEEGESWSLDGQAIGRLIGLDSVDLCEVSAIVDDANADFARIRMAGTAHGVVDGAATQIDLRGVGLFNLGKQRLTQLNLAIKEDRKVGPATPGFQGVAKTRIVIKPVTESPRLTDKRIDRLAKAKVTRATPLVAKADRQGFSIRHDRQWFAAGEDRRSLVLRRVTGADLAAQATFTVSDTTSAPSLEAFESQVRASLGASLQSLEQSEQWTNPAGCRCMAVVARGTVGGTPVEWRYYQAAGAEGSATAHQRVTLATTIEPTADEQTTVAARAMIHSMSLTLPKPVATASRTR